MGRGSATLPENHGELGFMRDRKDDARRRGGRHSARLRAWIPLAVGTPFFLWSGCKRSGETEDPPAVVGNPPAPSGQPAAKPTPEPNVIPLGGDRYQLGLVEIDKARRTLTFPAAVLMREGAVEYLVVTRKGKIHESVFVTQIEPRDLHLAALLLGVEPSADLGPADASVRVPAAAALQCFVEWDRNGPPARINLHEALAIAPAGQTTPAKPAPATLWLYNGSRVQQDGTFVAQRDGSIVSIIRDPDALINYPGDTRDDDEAHLPNDPALPQLEHPVRIVLKLR